MTVDKYNILVTGGAGFIGSNLAKALLSKGHKVVVVDNLSTGYERNIEELKTHKEFTFIQGNTNNYDEMNAIFSAQQFTHVYHYAACVGVQRTLENPMEVLEDIEGIKNILELSRITGVQHVLFSSSSEVYGESPTFPQDESNTPLNSRLPYAIVKNVGEAFFKSYAVEYDLPCTIFRFFNTYGPKQSEDFVVSKFIKQALAGEDLTVYGDGQQTRTFIYIDDNVEATTAALEKEEAMNETINIGSEIELPILELAKEIIALTKSTSKIKFLDPLKEGDMPRRIANNEKMIKMLSGRPKTNIQEGLKETIRYIKELEQ